VRLRRHELAVKVPLRAGGRFGVPRQVGRAQLLQRRHQLRQVERGLAALRWRPERSDRSRCQRHQTAGLLIGGCQGAWRGLRLCLEQVRDRRQFRRRALVDAVNELEERDLQAQPR